jgi:putative Holliday junction resolvase
MDKKLMKYLGIDWGEKRIGLALADSETKLATPFKTVEDADEIVKATKDEQIDIIVLGKPYQISNLQLPISKQFEEFLNELKNKTNIAIELVDERLSSKAADALVGNKKTKANRDEIAAMLILQSYLDKI